MQKFTTTVQIGNPVVGGAHYTSSKKASEYIARGRAFLDNGVLWFVDRIVATKKSVDPVKSVVSWNGSPTPVLMRKVRLSGMLIHAAPERIPGEVRS